MIDRKVLGILAALVFVVVVTWLQSPNFATAGNIETLLYRTSLFGIISIGAALVIVTGGIDLSIGSMICLVGMGLPWLLTVHGWPVAAALPIVLLLALALGFLHGILVTKLDLQPFVVTLCGLLLYRGIARWATDDRSLGFGDDYPGLRMLVGARWEITESFAPRAPLLILVVVVVLVALFLDRTVYGRYLLALGRNKEAARLSGIPVDRMIVVAYMLCAFLAGVGGILFVLDGNGGKASSLGSFYELYAIAGAVLGGCSLRGGEASVLGVVLGASLMQVLRSAIVQTDLQTELEFAVVGAVILAWVVVEEVVRRTLGRVR